MRAWQLLPLVLLALAAALPAARTSDAPEYSVTIAPGEVYGNSLTSLGGSVLVAGEVKESILMVGGRLDVNGTVGQDIITIGTQVTLGDGATVRHDLIVIGGKLTKGERVQISGEIMIVSSREDIRTLAANLLPFLPESGGKSLLKGIKITLWLIIALLLMTLAPRAVQSATELLRRRPIRVAAIGLAAMFLCLILLAVSVVLSLFIIGIPMLLILLSAYLVVLVLGRTVVYCLLGRAMLERITSRPVSPTFALLGGIAVYAVIKFLPLAGPFLLLLLDFFAVGAGVSHFLKRRFFPAG